jgi:hypothetical protein
MEQARMLAKKQEMERQQSQETAFASSVEKSKLDVTRCFPQTLDENDPLNLKAAELWKKMTAQNNPMMKQEDAPFLVYSMAAAMLNIKPVMPR